MEEIDQKLDQWISNSKIRAEIRSLIVSAIHTHTKTVLEDQLLDVKAEAFKAGWTKCALHNGPITN
mgnify:CR=1 FL=1|jgi:hypothetical protein